MTLFLGKNREPSDHFQSNADVIQTRQTGERGTAIFGVPGTGKSSLIEAMVHQDACNGEAIFVIDPHTDLIRNIIAQLPAHRLKDVYLLDLTDDEYPFSCNFLDGSRLSGINEATDRAEAIFKKIFQGDGEQLLLSKVLRMVSYTLLSSPGSTIAHIPELLEDETIRAAFVRNVHNRHVRNYWELTYNRMSPANQRKETYALTNRLPILLTKAMLEYILAQPQSTVDFRRSIDRKEIILINLPVDKYPEVAPLVGTVLIAEIYRAAFSYTDTDRDKRPGFSVYVDEWHEFVADDIGRMITNLRKFGCRLVLATQYRNKIKGPNYDAVMAASTIIAMKLSTDDARPFGALFVDHTKKPKLLKLYKDDLLKRLIKHDNELVYEFAKRDLKVWQDTAKDGNNKNQATAQKLLDAFEKLLIASEKKGKRDSDNSLFSNVNELSMWCYGHDQVFPAHQTYSQALTRWEALFQKRTFLDSIEKLKLLTEYYLVTFYDYFHKGLSDPSAWVMLEAVEKDTVFWDRVSAPAKDLAWLRSRSERIRRVNAVLSFMNKQVQYAVQQPDYKKPDDLFAATRKILQKEYDTLYRDTCLVLCHLYRYKATHMRASERLAGQYLALAEECARDREPKDSLPQLHDTQYEAVKGFWGAIFYDIKPWQKVTGRGKSRISYEPSPVIYNPTKEKDRQQLLFGLQEADQPAYIQLLDDYTQACSRLHELGEQLQYDSTLLKTYNLTHNDVYKQIEITQERKKFTSLDLLYKQREKEIFDQLIGLLQQESTAVDEAQARQKDYREKSAHFKSVFHYLANIVNAVASDPIGEYAKPETASDVAHILENLPPRHALVTMGQTGVSQTIYPLYTPDRPATVTTAELERRITEIRGRTRKTYCRPRAEVEADLAAAAHAPMQPPARRKEKQFTEEDLRHIQPEGQDIHPRYGEIEDDDDDE